EKLGGFAPLEPELQLAKRRRLTTGLYLSLVDGELDLAVPASDRIDPAPHARFESRLQAAPHALAEYGSERGVPGDVEFGLPAGDLVLPFVSTECGTFAVFVFDRLNMAAADASHLQRQALVAEPQLVGVEIDRNERCGFRRLLPRRLQQRAAS